MNLYPFRTWQEAFAFAAVQSTREERRWRVGRMFGKWYAQRRAS